MLDQQIQVPGWRGGDGDASYLDKTLLHQAMELSLDESVSGRTVLRLWGRAAAIAGAWYVFFLFIWLMSGGPDTSSLYGGGRGGDGGGSGLLTVAGLGSFVLFWLVFLMTRVQEPIGEWKVLLADRAAAKPDVYSQIHGRLRDRRLPISFSARRIRTGLGRDSVGDRVVLVDGHYTAYISVFDYGTSLYLGWMMWRTRRGASLLGRFLADVVGGMFGHTDPVKLMLRTERPRAMREAVHSVCREGLHVAVEGLSVPEAYGFPAGLPPIEDGELAAAMPPPSVPVPAMAASGLGMPESMSATAAPYAGGDATPAYETAGYATAGYESQAHQNQAYQQGYEDQAYAGGTYPTQSYDGRYQQPYDTFESRPPEPQQPHESGFFSRPQPSSPRQDPYPDGGYDSSDSQPWGSR